MFTLKKHEFEVERKGEIDVYDPAGLMNTVEGLSSGLRVEHIATFDLVTCRPSAQTMRVLSDPGLSAFDYVPVEDDGGRVVGVLDRDCSASGRVDQAMNMLNDCLVVSKMTGLTDFLGTIADRRFALVEDAGIVTGIVTRSDLLKLPVRVVAFAHISQLELVLGAIISRKYPHDSNDWTSFLAGRRRTMIEERYGSLARDRINLTIVEVAQFCDKRDVVRKILDLPHEFHEDLREIEKYRNMIAHSSTFIHNDDGINRFIACLQNTSKWVEQLARYD